MTQAQPPGWDRAVADSDEDSTAEYFTITYPRFYDVIDLVRYDLLDDLDAVADALAVYGYHFSDDPLDWIREDPEHEIATLCPVCGERWLMGPEALRSGKCWRCRTG